MRIARVVLLALAVALATSSCFVVVDDGHGHDRHHYWHEWR